MNNSSAVDRDDSNLEPLELDPLVATAREDRYASADLVAELSSEPPQTMKAPTITQSIRIGSTGTVLDVTAELDLLLNTIQQATPQPPRAARNLDLADRERHTHVALVENCQERTRQQQSRSISETIAEIAATEVDTDTQLHQELSNIHQQIVAARAELQSLHQRNQSQVDAVDANATEVDRLKVRTQQLAYYTKERVDRVQELISTVDGIRAEIVTGLERFGTYREMRSLLTELETTRHALVIAHDRLSTGQEAFYESLFAIEARVATQTNTAVQQLNRYRESIAQLSQTVSTDRLQIAGMSVDLSLKCAQLNDLSAQIAQMHAQITDTSQTLHSRATELDRGFAELTRSIQSEKEQFYEITAETIDRSAAIQSQFSNIATEFRLDREAIAAIQSELVSVREALARSSEQQLDYFDLQFYELMANWSDLSGYHHKQGGDNRKLLTWLWILSIGFGVMFVVLIYLLAHLK